MSQAAGRPGPSLVELESCLAGVGLVLQAHRVPHGSTKAALNPLGYRQDIAFECPALQPTRFDNSQHRAHHPKLG